MAIGDNQCASCGRLGRVIEYHLFQDTTVNLCMSCVPAQKRCTGLVRGTPEYEALHRRLTLQGIARAIAEGRREPRQFSAELMEKMRAKATGLANSMALEWGSIVQGMRDEGMSYRQIAATLTQHGIRTAQNKDRWSAMTVSNLLNRYRGLVSPKQ